MVLLSCDGERTSLTIGKSFSFNNVGSSIPGLHVMWKWNWQGFTHSGCLVAGHPTHLYRWASIYHPDGKLTFVFCQTPTKHTRWVLSNSDRTHKWLEYIHNVNLIVQTSRWYFVFVNNNGRNSIEIKMGKNNILINGYEG